MNEEEIVEIAKDEAEDIARCLVKFEQKHRSCEWCRMRAFCDFLVDKTK